MIDSIHHKGLKRFYENDDRRLLPPDMVERIRVVLAALDQANVIEDMNRPSFRLHPLKGELKGFWAVTVRANWRIIFRFADETATDVDLVDYH
jgi:proteic killer suppression protein